MKIALYVSGLIRRNELGYQHIKEMILEPNNHHDIDIYLDIWSNKISKFENKGKPDGWRAQRREKLSFEDDHDLNQIYNMYNPVAMRVESDKDATLFENLASQIQNGHKHKATPYALYSQFYKLFSVNHMRLARQIAFGLNYDMCLRVREESIYENKIILDSFEIDDRKIYVEKEGYSINHGSYGWVSDKFALCHPKVMDMYSAFALNFKIMNDEFHDKCVTTPEIYMKQYLVDALKLEVIKDPRIGKIGRY